MFGSPQIKHLGLSGPSVLLAVAGTQDEARIVVMRMGVSEGVLWGVPSGILCGIPDGVLERIRQDVPQHVPGEMLR
ncbi:MAG: hypothetical protein ABL908_06595 [Hyphomicrobium sp.]